MDKRLAGKLTVGQVAEKLGVTRQQIDKWLKSGRIKYEWIGPARYVRPEDCKKPVPLRKKK